MRIDIKVAKGGNYLIFYQFFLTNCCMKISLENLNVDHGQQCFMLYTGEKKNGNYDLGRLINWSLTSV